MRNKNKLMALTVCVICVCKEVGFARLNWTGNRGGIVVPMLVSISSARNGIGKWVWVVRKRGESS